MINLEFLPRLIADSYVDTMEEALDEVARRRADPASADSTSCIVDSPYGGFRVYTVSRTMTIEFYARLADEGAFLPMPSSLPSVSL